jgi:hypothetical protein
VVEGEGLMLGWLVVEEATSLLRRRGGNREEVLSGVAQGWVRRDLRTEQH